MNHIETLEALLNDVKGNEFLGDAKKMSGYLKSMSLAADALSRRYWQQFELEVIDELKEIRGSAAVTKALDVKAKLAQREYELADLQVKLADFHTSAAVSAFVSKEAAAESLRKIADEIEAQDSELFPKPWSLIDIKAYAVKMGATLCTTAEADSIVKRSAPKAQFAKVKTRKTGETAFKKRAQ